jgi:3-keto-5-aminohexanoate cleavage enzyme
MGNQVDRSSMGVVPAHVGAEVSSSRRRRLQREADVTLAANLAKPLIISCAITGSVTTRRDHPALPITPSEIATSAIEAAEAGAACVHIHVREADGTPSSRGELYHEVFERIRAQSDVLICATTGSGAGRFDDTGRFAALAYEPDLASFDAGSMNFGDRVFENSPAFLRELARQITSRRIIPEIECFDVGQIGNALRLQTDGLLPGPTGKWWFQFCLGVAGGAPATPNVLLTMRSHLPPDAEWSVLAIGRAQLPMSLVAIVEGGHVRTGLEDNVYYRRGELAASNAQFVTRLVNLAGELDRPVATPNDTRALLGAV